MFQAYPLLFTLCCVICLQGRLVYGGPSCGEREVCDNLNRLQTEVEVNTAQLTKWNSHYDFVQQLQKNFREEVADIVQEVIAKKPESSPSDLSTNEIMERLKKIEETVASIRSLEKESENVVSALQSQGDATHCLLEPPFLPNGKPKKFERKSGSRVQYECNQNYAMTGSSTVVCSSGEWTGHPPACSYFDATFTLQHVLNNKSRIITCYTDKNYKNTVILRVRATQEREHLPSEYPFTTNSDGKYARVEVPASVKFGAYQCQFIGEEGPMTALFLKQFFVEDLQPVVRFQIANIGDKVEFEITKFNLFDHQILWKHDGVAVPAWDNLMKVEIPNVKLSDAGFYEGHYEWRRGNADNTFLRLVVRKCKANLYGENCDQVCPVCYNGGVCHDGVGVCVCPAGFTGDNCEKACPGGYFGVNCTKPCDTEGEEGCKGHMFCKPDPLGCACASGFKGYNCQESCEEGSYGASCKQPCHCFKGHGACNRFTGVCAGRCSPGWTGDSCQIAVQTIPFPV